MLRDPTIDAVWCADGGAGASYLVPWLKASFENVPWEARKPVIGFSDCTFLTTYLTTLGHLGILGPNLSSTSNAEDAAISRCARFLLHPRDFHVFENLDADVLQEGEVKAPLLGGTFGVLREMMGTRFCPRFEDKLIFFEEHGTMAPGEHEYIFWDRIQGIQLGQWWEDVAGFAIGEIELGGAYEEDQGLFTDIWTILEKTIVPMTDGPVVASIPFGAATKAAPLPLGVQATLKAKRGKCSLTFDLPSWFSVDS
jgi:muramoyltetrapeptide carboxypeptidase LdcA involved in peptidoglycan recycling